MRALLAILLCLPACAAQPPRSVEASRDICEGMARIYGAEAPAGYRVAAIWTSASNAWRRCDDMDVVSMPHVFVINVVSTRMVVIADCRREP